MAVWHDGSRDNGDFQVGCRIEENWNYTYECNEYNYQNGSVSFFYYYVTNLPSNCIVTGHTPIDVEITTENELPQLIHFKKLDSRVDWATYDGLSTFSEILSTNNILGDKTFWYSGEKYTIAQNSLTEAIQEQIENSNYSNKLCIGVGYSESCVGSSICTELPRRINDFSAEDLTVYYEVVDVTSCNTYNLSANSVKISWTTSQPS